jgi:capsular polysaccharide export protein
MKNIKYLFISRVSSHYRYYQKLVGYLGPQSELHKIKSFVLPRFRFLAQAKQLDLAELVHVHVERKKVRHPFLTKSRWLVSAFTTFYQLLEYYRASYYLSFFQNNNVENLIIWNGQKQPNKTPYIVAKELGIKTHLFENGLLPNTTVLDTKGVNALNSMPREPEFYLNWNPTPEQIDEVKNATKLQSREKHKLRSHVGHQIRLPKHYLFVPFQVPNDTQIICHSPWIKSMEDFYDELVSAAVSLPKDHVFVVKEHPSWPRSFVHLHHRHPKIIFANENNTQELIENAAAVITINSTVGIESLLLDKKVITLGDSFLNITGLVQHCSEQQALQEAISKLDKWQSDPILRERFLAFLKYQYLIDQRWDKLTQPEEHFSAVLNRLKKPFTTEQ